ncbi:MAG: hypothetical protein KGY78_10770, partial [Anaerolineae bacterium]|nr:hypothetical protein [Anaerolineae bacterium]
MVLQNISWLCLGKPVSTAPLLQLFDYCFPVFRENSARPSSVHRQRLTQIPREVGIVAAGHAEAL